jgi:hypothetical protein
MSISHEAYPAGLSVGSNVSFVARLLKILVSIFTVKISLCDILNVTESLKLLASAPFMSLLLTHVQRIDTNEAF